MEYPVYPTGDEPYINPAEVLITHTGEDMFMHPLEAPSSDRPLSFASYAIGITCQRAVTEDRLPHTNDLLTAANIILKQQQLIKSSQSPSELAESRLLRTTANIINLHADAQEVLKQRTIAHGAVVKALESSLREVNQETGTLPNRTRKAVGDVAHYTALGLLTRLRHPRLFALSALPHQDHRTTGYTSDNFDLTIIESRDKESLYYTTEADGHDDGDPADAEVHKVQVKRPCLGYCPHEIDVTDQADFLDILHAAKTIEERKKQKRESSSSDYAPDITMISGCCDLDIHIAGGRMTAPLATLMIAEAKGFASVEQIASLDTASNSLMLTITADPSRRGTATEPVPWQAS